MFKNKGAVLEQISKEAMEFICELNSADPRRNQQAVPVQLIEADNTPDTDFNMQVDAGCFSEGVTCWGETILSACHRQYQH